MKNRQSTKGSAQNYSVKAKQLKQRALNSKKQAIKDKGKKGR